MESHGNHPLLSFLCDSNKNGGPDKAWFITFEPRPFWLFPRSKSSEIQSPKAVGIPTWLYLKDIFFITNGRISRFLDLILNLFCWCLEFSEGFLFGPFLEWVQICKSSVVVGNLKRKLADTTNRNDYITSINLLHCFWMMESF